MGLVQLYYEMLHFAQPLGITEAQFLADSVVVNPLKRQLSTVIMT